jgi:competence protein ComEC
MGFIYWGMKVQKIRHLTAPLAGLLILQLVVVFEHWENSKVHQLWLLYQHNKTIIAHHTPIKLVLYSPQKITEEGRLINDFKNEYPIDTIQIEAFKNTFITNELNLLVLDEKAIYNIPDFEATHLLMSSNPMVNLDRVLENLRPKMVFSDGSNYPWNVSRWKISCQKHNVPFVNLREQGAYAINL